jgi:hypothetical protein
MVGASDQFVSQALYFAYWTYVQVFSLLIKVFRISSREEFRAVWEPAGATFSRTWWGDELIASTSVSAGVEVEVEVKCVAHLAAIGFDFDESPVEAVRVDPFEVRDPRFEIV